MNRHTILRWLGALGIVAMLAAPTLDARGSGGHGGGGGHASSGGLASGAHASGRASDSRSTTVHVRGYMRKDGTVVAAYDRSAPEGWRALAETTPSGIYKTTEMIIDGRPVSRHTDRQSVVISPPMGGVRFAPHVSPHDQAVYLTSTNTIHRSQAEKHAFEVQSGYPHGRPGYVVDHIIPLAKDGPDQASNMQWQTIAEGKAKDKVERR